MFSKHAVLFEIYLQFEPQESLNSPDEMLNYICYFSTFQNDTMLEMAWTNVLALQSRHAVYCMYTYILCLYAHSQECIRNLRNTIILVFLPL